MLNKEVSIISMKSKNVMSLTNSKNIFDSENETKNEKSCRRRAYFQQFISVLSGYIFMITEGTSTTWTSPALPLLRKEDSEIHLSLTEETILVSISSVTGIIGYLLVPVLANRIGRKYSILVYGMFLLLALVLTYLASSFSVLLTARMIMGAGSSAIYGHLSLYIGEIAHEDVRGSFLTFDKMCVNIGAFLITVAGAFLTYKTMNLVMIIAPIIGFAIFPLTLETPYYYLMKNKEKEAIATRMKLSATDKIEEIMEEIERMKSAIKEGQESKKNSLQDLFLDPGSRKALIIKLLTSATLSFSGYGVIQAYAQDVFNESGSLLAPEHCVMIMTGFQIIAGLFSSQIVDLWGRRPTFLLSGVMASLSLTILGGFFFFKSYLLMDVSAFSAIPLVGLIFFTFSCNMGLTSVPYLYAGELFSIKVKGIATTVSLISETLLSFLSKIIFPFVNQAFGIYTSFWIFGILCFSGAVSVFLFAPETKGKNLEEVLEILKVKEKNVKICGK